jgi:hypothetical protein
MGVVPGVYDVRGYHEFESGNWNGLDWCAVCDCLIDEHISQSEYLKREAEFKASAARYHDLRKSERGI